MGWFQNRWESIKRFFTEFARKIRAFVTEIWDEVDDIVMGYLKEDGWRVVLGGVVKMMPEDISNDEKYERVYDMARNFLENQSKEIDNSLIRLAIDSAVEVAKKDVKKVEDFLNSI